MEIKRKMLHMAIVAALMLATSFSLGGCELAYLLAGNGSHAALYKLPKKDRLLVLVDTSANSQLTIHAMATLMTLVNQILYQHKCANNFVPAYRIVALQRQNPVQYHSMGIADIAQAVNANVVVYVFVKQFDVTLESAGQLTKGNADALVKVVDKNGNRLWPKDGSPGLSVTARIPTATTVSQSPEAVQNAMVTILARRISRMFYRYSIGYQPQSQ
ncbi:MAG: hypothetical protein ACP5VQ_03555 [Phycisphaerae bacterium]